MEVQHRGSETDHAHSERQYNPITADAVDSEDFLKGVEKK
jgi:hypothetical protein